MGLGMSTPSVKVPKMGGKKGAKKAKPAKKGAKPAKGAKKAKPAKKGRKGKKSGYEVEEEYEDEDFLTLAPAAFEGVAVQAGLRKPVSKFEDEDYEEGEDYEEDEYEEEEYNTQKFAPADFANVATPTNMSLVLLALLFIMIVLSRR
jgi:hypothetical protein